MKKILLLILLTLSTQLYAQSSLENGINLFDQEKYSAAKKIFEGVLEKNDGNGEGHIYLAKCLFQLGDLDEAIEHGERAVELDEKNADYHFELGLLYAEDARDASIFRAPFVAGKVKEEFEKTVALDPNHLEGRTGLAEF